eukprot:10233736-Ditylum_brightwellii.AAC.1
MLASAVNTDRQTAPSIDPRASAHSCKLDKMLHIPSKDQMSKKQEATTVINEFKLKLTFRVLEKADIKPCDKFVAFLSFLTTKFPKITSEE